MSPLYSFYEALHMIIQGIPMRRAGWNGVTNGMKMFVKSQFPDEGSANTKPYLYMQVELDRAPWVPSQLDMFAQDWEEVELI